jgi:hypothetical protein
VLPAIHHIRDGCANLQESKAWLLETFAFGTSSPLLPTPDLSLPRTSGCAQDQGQGREVQAIAVDGPGSHFPMIAMWSAADYGGAGDQSVGICT